MTAARSLLRQGWPWLILALLLLAVAIGYSTFPVTQNTYRYLFVVDITQSMNVDDMLADGTAATRLDFAKSAMAAGVKQLPCGSEVGLAVFSAHRTFVLATPVEVCEHFRDLSEMLAKLDWRMAWVARSEVAKGLYSSIAAAASLEPAAQLVFLTDGHEAPPLHRELRPNFRAEPGSVTGFIGGVGGQVPMPIPRLDDDGKIMGYWAQDDVMQIDVYSVGRAGTQSAEALAGVNMANIARRIALGQEHLSALREQHLQDLGNQTGLDYVRVASSTDFVENLLNERYAMRSRVSSDLGWVPASLALLCLMQGLVFTPWRNRPRR